MNARTLDGWLVVLVAGLALLIPARFRGVHQRLAFTLLLPQIVLIALWVAEMTVAPISYGEVPDGHPDVLDPALEVVLFGVSLSAGVALMVWAVARRPRNAAGGALFATQALLSFTMFYTSHNWPMHASLMSAFKEARSPLGTRVAQIRETTSTEARLLVSRPGTVWWSCSARFGCVECDGVRGLSWRDENTLDCDAGSIETFQCPDDLVPRLVASDSIYARFRTDPQLVLGITWCGTQDRLVTIAFTSRGHVEMSVREQGIVTRNLESNCTADHLVRLRALSTGDFAEELTVGLGNFRIFRRGKDGICSLDVSLSSLRGVQFDNGLSRSLLRLVRELCPDPSELPSF